VSIETWCGAPRGLCPIRNKRYLKESGAMGAKPSQHISPSSSAMVAGRISTKQPRTNSSCCPSIISTTDPFGISTPLGSVSRTASRPAAPPQTVVTPAIVVSPLGYSRLPPFDHRELVAIPHDHSSPDDHRCYHVPYGIMMFLFPLRLTSCCAKHALLHYPQCPSGAEGTNDRH
jgi:hypothetical protein